LSLKDQSIEIVEDTAIKYGKKELYSLLSNSDNDLLCPSYKVKLGSDRFISGDESKVVSIRVLRSIGLPTDSCEVFLVGKRSYSFNKGDEAKILLGYGEKTESVFSGLIEQIVRDQSLVKISAIGPALSLLRLRVNRVYLSQSAGKIVSSLAQEAKLQVKMASDGINLPTYVIDDATNAYEHVLKLADRCNFNVFINEEDQLVFEAPSEGKNYPLYFGKEIIKIDALDFSPLFAGSRIWGESPSSIKGSDTSHWLTKQEVKGEAGDEPVMSLQDPAVKDNKTAETVAKSKTSKLNITQGVVVDVVGKPEIKLGESISPKNVPISDLKSPLEIRSFEHYLSKNKGFTTTINAWARGNDA
jgi:hypothetical protein